MKTEIVNKISIELNELQTEAQVVYILTRIGKLLEVERKKREYPILNFYRNWCVHFQLDDSEYRFSKKFKKILHEFLQVDNTSHKFLFHDELIKELNKFLRTLDIELLDDERSRSFVFLLGKVISDTPIKICLNGINYEIAISEPKDIMQSGLSRITINVTP